VVELLEETCYGRWFRAHVRLVPIMKQRRPNPLDQCPQRLLARHPDRAEHARSDLACRRSKTRVPAAAPRRCCCSRFSDRRAINRSPPGCPAQFAQLPLDSGTEEVAPQTAEVRRRVVSATALQSRIKELDLGRTFDAVLLPSHLINGPDPQPLLAAAGRHLASDGVLVTQRLEPGRRWQEGFSQAGPVRISLSHLTIGLPRVAARTTYRTVTGVWDQDWVLFERDDTEITLLLADFGLGATRVAGPG
jgi:hypothetical protein